MVPPVVRIGEQRHEIRVFAAANCNRALCPFPLAPAEFRQTRNAFARGRDLPAPRPLSSSPRAVRYLGLPCAISALDRGRIQAALFCSGR